MITTRNFLSGTNRERKVGAAGRQEHALLCSCSVFLSIHTAIHIPRGVNTDVNTYTGGQIPV